ncbi:MAG: gamma carbonic anhydrase family protein [bacterium]|nr:gamma carbonic anhydrase family protein [bacterium]
MPKIISFNHKSPNIDPSVLLAEGTVIIGDVVIGKDSSIWYQSVLRGDINKIRIGERTNIQDLSVVHVETDGHPTLVGNDVTVGHRVILHGCEVKDRVLIGMGSILMNGVVVGDDVMIGAGSLLTEGMVVPPRTLVLGSPARVKRDLTAEEISQLPVYAKRYVLTARLHRKIS